MFTVITLMRCKWANGAESVRLKGEKCCGCGQPAGRGGTQASHNRVGSFDRDLLRDNGIDQSLEEVGIGHKGTRPYPLVLSSMITCCVLHSRQITLIKHDQSNDPTDEASGHQKQRIPPGQVMVDQRVDGWRVVEWLDFNHPLQLVGEAAKGV